MTHIRKNDIVKVLAGKDRGKTGKVLAVLCKTNRAIVEGVNFLKKHTKRTRDDQQGGIIQRESSIHLSNLAVFCKNCTKETRVGINILQDGTKARFCKRCKEIL